ncbi:MAG: hypothetical protein GY856_16490 [bacterium]|nr:hypothetical protein [bacterium]
MLRLAILIILLAGLYGPATAQDPAAERLFQEARRLEQEADATAALQDLMLLVQQFPADRLAPRALLRIVELHRARGERDAAKTAAEQLLANHARSPEAAAAFNLQAEIQVEEARGPVEIEEARATFRRVPLLYGRESFPDLEARSQARIRTAELSLLLGEPDDAAAELVAVIEDAPPSRWTGRAQLRLASALVAGGEPTAAAEILQRLAAAGDETSDAADRARAGRLLSLLHRRLLRPLAGQRHWLTSGRFPASGLALREPTGVAAAEDGRVVIVDRRLPLVALLDPDGRELGRKALRDAQNPGWLADGRPYVAVEGTVVLPFDGERFAFSDPRPGRDTAMKNLFAAARDPFGYWYVAAKGWKSLLRYTSPRQGRELLGSSRPEFKDLARDQRGRIYALDAEAAQVVRIGIDGRPEGVIVRGSWKKAEALAVDPLGHLYVLDRDTRQVEVFDPGGQRLTRVGPQLGAGVELRQPVDLAVDGSGRLFIADSKLPFVVMLD